jgi:carboxypeptidase C (cathepsin A)
MLPAMRRLLGIFLLAASLAGCGGGGGGGSASTPAPAAPPANFVDPNLYSVAGSASLATPNENTAVTKGSVTVNGQALAYTATAGHLTVRRLGTDAVDASMFYVAYTLDGRDPATRPVTFFYNGGPGSASMWLHLGSFAPKRLAVDAPSQAVPRPFAFVDNAETLLDVSDLVFVDAVGTGLSQAIAPNTNSTFWSVDADAAVFRDFIRRYVATNNRQASPRFLFGESYGGPRSAVLAHLMESAGLRLAGVVLWSPALNYNSNCGTNTTRVSCAGYFPSYGATAAFHQRTTPPRPAGTSDAYAVEMRALTASTYAPAISAFLATGAIPPPATLQTFTDAAGLTVTTWQASPNIGATQYRASLIPGSVLGRYDARMAAQGVTVQTDISTTFVSGSFIATMQSYLAGTLGFTTPSTYVSLSNAIETWDFSHDGQPLPDTVPDLLAAMTINPRLRVFSVSGYHDLATPYHQTELDLARIGPHPNVTIRNYDGGHMTYFTDASRVRQKADLVRFYEEALRP